MELMIYDYYFLLFILGVFLNLKITNFKKFNKEETKQRLFKKEN